MHLHLNVRILIWETPDHNAMGTWIILNPPLFRIQAQRKINNLCTLNRFYVLYCFNENYRSLLLRTFFQMLSFPVSSDTLQCALFSMQFICCIYSMCVNLLMNKTLRNNFSFDYTDLIWMDRLEVEHYNNYGISKLIFFILKMLHAN